MLRYFNIEQWQPSGRHRVSKPSLDLIKHKSKSKIKAQRRGRAAEWLSRLYLRAHGRRILAANFKTPVGEIDIIAKRGNLIVFVEVKRRADIHQAAWSISSKQKQRIQRAAQYFLMQRPMLQTCDIRFDVALISHGLRLKYIADAWRP